jgi:hypothetical protein
MNKVLWQGFLFESRSNRETVKYLNEEIKLLGTSKTRLEEEEEKRVDLLRILQIGVSRFASLSPLH